MAECFDDFAFGLGLFDLLTLKTHQMKFPWFKRAGMFFIPISLIGWLLVAAAIAFAVYVFRDIDSRSHSVSDTLINFVFNLLIIIAVYSLIAFLSSKKTKA